ncbi:Initiation factor 2B-related protein [Corchorus olitorius]|uniref:Translation initiation factor eIF2B subunit beta n=1 Tax=Corchorus olitorius TaxID=93759 RepID=A0A1R3IT59_9ROSI|nr:Initiation factor 2B-related protein [Corchorus olitorius]
MPDTQALVNDFLNKLKKRKIEGSQATAKQTAELLRSVISQTRVPYTNQAGALIDSVKAVGERLIAANPVELAVGNIVRRVLHIIREEDLSLTTAAMAGLNLSAVSDDEDDTDRDDHPTLLEDVPDSAAVPHTSSSGGDSEGKSKSADKSSRSRKLKHDVIEAVNELIQDINTCHEQIAEQAVEHIHQKQFKNCAGISLCRKREEKIISGICCRGRSKVIVGAHAVMANGGVIAPVGLNMVALAAQKHAVPFVVLAGSHKLCPLYPHNPEVLLNELRSPSELLDFGEFSDLMDFGSGKGAPLLHVVNPTFDYVPPKLVSLFITDTGGHNPSYMYRLIADYYSADDLVVQRRPTSGN